MILAEFGAEEASGDGFKIISMFSEGSYSLTYGVKNLKDTPLEVSLDLSQSENLSFSSKGPVVRKVVPSGGMAFMMHAQSGFGKFSVAMKHSAKEPVTPK